MAEDKDYSPPWLLQKPPQMFPEDWERLTEAYWLYTNMYFRHTEITRAFLHPLNVAYINSMLNRALSEIVGHKFTCKEFYTGELAQSLADTAYGNSSYANTNDSLARTEIAIDTLTGKFIDSWISDLWIGWRNEARFHEWAIEDNRMKFFPYPEQEQHTKNDTAIVTGDYMLASPWSVGYGDFLKRFKQPECLDPDPTSLPFFFNRILNPAFEFERGFPVP